MIEASTNINRPVADLNCYQVIHLCLIANCFGAAERSTIPASMWKYWKNTGQESPRYASEVRRMFQDA